jgi:hypothetical protein
VVPEPGVFYCFFNFNFYYSCIINFTITILIFLFLPSSFSLLLQCYDPLLSLPTTLSAPSHPLNPPSSLTLLTSPNLSPQYLFLLHTYHPMTSLLYKLYTTPAPVIPYTSTLHYNRNTPKHTQGPQKTAAPISLSLLQLLFLPPLFCTIFTNYPNFQSSFTKLYKQLCNIIYTYV